MATRGRPPVLDECKRRDILAIVAVGCGRQAAAEYVGCSVSTIYRTAERDSEFAQQLRQKETYCEVGYLRSIHKASQTDRYWRAAAWALERIKPDKYARRGPDIITVKQVGELMAQFAEIIVEEVPVAKYRKKILTRIGGLLQSLKHSRAKKEASK